MNLYNIFRFIAFQTFILTNLLLFTMEQPKLPKRNEVEQKFICKGLINLSDEEIIIQFGPLQNEVIHSIKPNKIKRFDYSFSNQESGNNNYKLYPTEAPHHCKKFSTLTERYSEFMFVYKNNLQAIEEIQVQD